MLKEFGDGTGIAQPSTRDMETLEAIARNPTRHCFRCRRELEVKLKTRDITDFDTQIVHGAENVCGPCKRQISAEDAKSALALSSQPQIQQRPATCNIEVAILDGRVVGKCLTITDSTGETHRIRLPLK